MQIILNQQPLLLPDSCTVAQMLQLQGITPRLMAIAINQRVVPQSVWAETLLQEGDKITLISAAKGG